MHQPWVHTDSAGSGLAAKQEGSGLRSVSGQQEALAAAREGRGWGKINLVTMSCSLSAAPEGSSNVAAYPCHSHSQPRSPPARSMTRAPFLPTKELAPTCASHHLPPSSGPREQRCSEPFVPRRSQWKALCRRMGRPRPPLGRDCGPAGERHVGLQERLRAPG